MSDRAGPNIVVLTLADIMLTAHRRQTHCRHGHLLDGANVYLYKGERRCRACNARRVRRHRNCPTQLRDVLPAMAEELRLAEPGRRHFIWDGPKVANVIGQPSTYPSWMDGLVTRRTRANADRLIRVIEAALAGAPIAPRDRKLWRSVREWAAEPEWVHE